MSNREEKVEGGLEVVAWRYTSSHSFGRKDRRWHYQENFPKAGARQVQEIGQLEPLVRQSDAERAVQQEMERHRKAWRQLEQVRGLLDGVRKLTKSQRMDDLVWLMHKGRIDAALSQQAEPALSIDDVMSAVLPDDHPMKPKAKPAPVQDERLARLRHVGLELMGVIDEYRAMPCESLRQRMFSTADRYRRRLNSAQTEQQPVALPPFAAQVLEKLERVDECFSDGQGADIGREWFDILTLLGLLKREQIRPALWSITQQGRDALAAPIAQTADEFNDQQWWFKELEQVVSNGTPDQRRALAVVRNLLKQTAPQPEQSGLVKALEYYANGDHLLLADPDAWDTCSGEPLNFLHDEAGTASVEDGAIAKVALEAYRAALSAQGDRE